ncbi:ATP-binding protein [Sorangium sp. So ce145]|uniref:ATP-binding protein n=1 Tax=Sorangium sp. So ce145 TaxID=3133285 RepID=UPI003F6376FD
MAPTWVIARRVVEIRGKNATTNKHPKRWGAVLHDDDLADAIVDRILHRGRLLRLDGPSVRTKHLPEGELRVDDQEQAGRSRFSGLAAADFPEPTRSF